MKNIYCLGCLLFLTACAGTPPAWWDPAGTYSNQTTDVSTTEPSAQTPVVRKRVEAAIPAEEEIEPMQDMYEEMDLPVSAEAAEDTVKSPAVTSAETANKTAALASETSQEATALSVTESLPDDGSLPAPSVLN